jgi:hypothetical protein
MSCDDFVVALADADHDAGLRVTTPVLGLIC